MTIGLQTILVSVALLASAALAEAQQQSKMSRVGFLAAAPTTTTSVLFGQHLRALGYVDGKNMVIDFRHADNKVDRLPLLAEELVRQKVDILVTSATSAALALKDATKTIPIVFFIAGDPIEAGLVDSLPRPGGNITGFTNVAPQLAGKRLELLKESVPKLSRVALMWDPRIRGSEQSWKESQLAGRDLGLQLYSMEVRDAERLEGAFEEAVKARTAALAAASSSLFNTHQKRIAELAMKNKLPAIFDRALFVESGGLMSYSADPNEATKRGAIMVDKILKGTKPADIPVEQPMSFELAINLKTAKTLGIVIPPIVLMRATRVIK
jgi:putative tryptophan/tyrosine transport system substrate-binding protein